MWLYIKKRLHCRNINFIIIIKNTAFNFYAISCVPHVVSTLLPFVCVQANLTIQESRLRVANNELGEAEAQLAEKQAEFDKVKAKCDAAMREKQVWFSLKNVFKIEVTLR